jgi:hypothetical protein
MVVAVVVMVAVFGALMAVGRTVDFAERRGKWLAWETDNGVALVVEEVAKGAMLSKFVLMGIGPACAVVPQRSVPQ